MGRFLGCHTVSSCAGAAHTVSAYPVLAGRRARCTRLGRRSPGATTAPEGEDHVKAQARLGCKRNILHALDQLPEVIVTVRARFEHLLATFTAQPAAMEAEITTVWQQDAAWATAAQRLQSIKAPGG